MDRLTEALSQPPNTKMSTIKDRKGHNRAEDIMKRWQKYTEELFKKDLHNRQSRQCDHSPRARHPGM